MIERQQKKKREDDDDIYDIIYDRESARGLFYGIQWAVFYVLSFYGFYVRSFVSILATLSLRQFQSSASHSFPTLNWEHTLNSNYFIFALRCTLCFSYFINSTSLRFDIFQLLQLLSFIKYD